MKFKVTVLFLLGFGTLIASLNAETIFFRDGTSMTNVSSVKELNNYFLVKRNGITKTYSKSKVKRIEDNYGRIIYEYRVLTADKFTAPSGLRQYRFYVNNSEVATGGWNNRGFFEITRGSIPDGDYLQYFDNGKLERIFPIKNNTLNGISKVFYKSGIISREGYFKSGREEGESKLYYKTGELKGKSLYKEGLKDGPTYLYFKSNGKVKAEMTFEEGKINGLQKMYYKNGKIATEVYFNDGEKNGPFKQYYSNGKVKIEGIFRNGKLDGKVSNFYESGRLKSEKIFSNGRILKENSSK